MQPPSPNLVPNGLCSAVGDSRTEVDEELAPPVLRFPRTKRIAQEIKFLVRVLPSPIFILTIDNLRLLRMKLADPEFGFVEMEGTEGAVSPFFSPEGERIAFFDESGLKTVSMDSGVPTAISLATGPAVFRGAAWIDPQTFVYAPSANDPLAVLQWMPGPLPTDMWIRISELPAPSSWPAALPGGRELRRDSNQPLPTNPYKRRS